MGGKSKQSQRTKNNVRPSSSGRSAVLLNNAVRMDPGLAGVAGGGGGGAKGLPALFPTLAAPALLDAALNPEFTLCLKKLTKKDPITKTKALQELCDLIKKSEVEDVAAALPSWAHYYRALTTDTDHKVREAAQIAQGALVSACGRRVAPALKQLLPPWLQAQYDEYAPAAAAARKALHTTFPESKLPDVISFCKDEVIAHLLENLVGNAEAALNKKNLTSEEKELQYVRLVTGSLQGLEYFTQHLAAAHDAWLWAQLAPLLQAAAFWRLPDRPAQQIRTAWYGALGRIISRFKDTFGAAYGQKTARLLLSGSGGGGGAQVWGCLLLLMHHVKDWHTWVDKKELLIKRILDVLENGGWGDAKHLSSMLLPMLAYLPEQMLTKEFYESFFNAVFKGLEKKAVMSSKSERQSWITSLSECLRYLTVQQKDYVVEVATAVHRTWLERVLAGSPDTQTTNNLIKHSATNMVSLVKYWMKQSKEPNGEKYDQLVRNFWQNVGSTVTAQIDRLSTEQSDINTLVEAHILLLQSLKTSFAQDVKRVKSIKFIDEKQESTEASEESSPQCDALIADRFKHNLDEVVQKISAQYFEFAQNKQVVNSVFAPLLTLLIEFDDENLFKALARRFEAESVLGLYDRVLRGWLAGDTMRCKDVARVVFLLMKHVPENEQEAILDSFKQFPPSVVEWCISLSLSHPYRSWGAARRWLRSALVEGSLLAAARRMLAGGDAAARGLLLMCLANDGQGEMMISDSTVSKIVSLVSEALSPSAPALERLAGAAAALASELSGAADCCGLALALHGLQLQLARGDPRLSPETWCEVRAAWQDAGAASSDFRAQAVRAVHDQLTLLSESLNIQGIEHVVSLCPYLLADFDASQYPEDTQLAAQLVNQLFRPPTASATATAPAFAIRHDCIRGRLNCLFDDDNEHVKKVIEESSRTDVEELTESDALAFVNKLVFEASFLKTLALHRDEEEVAWGETLFAEDWFVEEFGKVLYDYAVLCSLYEGYAFWPHYDIISVAKSHVTLVLDEVIADMPAHGKARTLAHLGARAATTGYYWSEAHAALREKLRGREGEEGEGERRGEEEAADFKLEEVVTGNGFFHTLQADTRYSRDPRASLRAKYLVMLRSYYLAHAHEAAVIDDQFVRDAAAAAAAADARAEDDPDVIINAYYRHQHTMLYDCDISKADWRQVVSNAAIVDYLTEMVDVEGWAAPAQRWDFTTITLCSLATALHNSVQHWGTTKVSLLARAVLGLFRAAQRFVGGVRGECVRREPAAHVAELPTEWADIFAPDLHCNLFSIVVHVLASASSAVSGPQAAFISALLATAPRLDWHLLPEARRRGGGLSVPELLRAGVPALARPAHHAYKYLAHALLAALAKPLVVHDAEILAVWTNDGSNEDEEAPRPALALQELQPALSRLQQLGDMALHTLQVGEETCSMVPFTDSHSVTLGYLLLADVACGAATLARSDLVHHYLQLFREARHAEVLVTSALRLLPAAVAAHALDSSAPAPQHCTHMFLTDKQFTLDEPSSAQDIGWLACRALYHCARWSGGALRGWWGAAPPRAARALERILRAHVSPALVRDQLQAVCAAAAAGTLQDAEVTVHQSTNEVVCAFVVEERTMELTVSLGAAHPLPPPRVHAAAPAHNTHWLAVYLAYQNGTVLSALRMWMDAVARRVEAAPQCYICYCRLHPTTGRLPRVPCHQCRNKFHAHCLRKWFTSSSKSNCPLCRAVF